ncbi:MAG: hypothetical protein ACRDZO_16055 [Egibacteraceae bacterium]
MSMSPGERTGLVLVRAWVEGNDRSTFRVRITQRNDITETEQTVTATATVEETCEAVRRWLERFLEGAF